MKERVRGDWVRDLSGNTKARYRSMLIQHRRKVVTYCPKFHRKWYSLQRKFPPSQAMVALWIISPTGITNITSRSADDKCNRKKFVGDFRFLLHSRVTKNAMFPRAPIRKTTPREMME